MSSFHANRTAVALAFLSVLTIDSCTTKRYDGADFIRYYREQRHAPAENIWNNAGVWKRVSDNPAVYIPAQYPLHAPRTADQGRWIVDVRDGKRFFVPNGEVTGQNHQVLVNDAIKHSGAPRPVAEEGSWGFVP